MKNKNFFPIILLIIVILIIIISIISTNINNKNSSKDFTPEQEIDDKTLRETVVTLYFLDGEGNLKSEGKLIDSIKLLENPYKEIVNLLIEGPKSDSLKSIFPENTKILSATIDNNCVTLNFSEELLNYADETEKYNIINCILNSLAQLNEVDSIKIQINGQTSDSLNEEYSMLYRKP